MKSTPHRANFGAAWQNELFAAMQMRCKSSGLRLEMAVAPDRLADTGSQPHEVKLEMTLVAVHTLCGKVILAG